MENNTKERVLNFIDRMDTKGVSMDTRMKQYERETPQKLPPNVPYAIRIDGKNFSRFTYEFKKPADSRIRDALVVATKELMEFFHATTAYTCSDEITLIFPLVPVIEDGEEKWVQKHLDYSGRRQKLESLAASVATLGFYRALMKLLVESEREGVDRKSPHFDARVIMFPTNVELVNNVMWRVRDFRKNSISALADVHFSPKSLLGLTSSQRIDILRTEKNINWSEQPRWTRLGIFVKQCPGMRYGKIPYWARAYPLIGVFERDKKWMLDTYWGPELNFLGESSVDDFGDDDADVPELVESDPAKRNIAIGVVDPESFLDRLEKSLLGPAIGELPRLITDDKEIATPRELMVPAEKAYHDAAIVVDNSHITTEEKICLACVDELATIQSDFKARDDLLRAHIEAFRNAVEVLNEPMGSPSEEPDDDNLPILKHANTDAIEDDISTLPALLDDNDDIRFLENFDAEIPDENDSDDIWLFREEGEDSDDKPTIG